MRHSFDGVRGSAWNSESRPPLSLIPARGDARDVGDGIDEGRQDDFAGGVEFGGVPGKGEVFDAARRTALLDNAVDDQQRAIGDDP